MTKANHFEAFNTYGPKIIYVPENTLHLDENIWTFRVHFSHTSKSYCMQKNDNGTGITSRLELLMEVIQIFA